jgi:hypothetical protein
MMMHEQIWKNVHLHDDDIVVVVVVVVVGAVAADLWPFSNVFFSFTVPFLSYQPTWTKSYHILTQPSLQQQRMLNSHIT